MTNEPTWTWRLRADASKSKLARCGYWILRWCTDTSPLTNRIISILSLLASVGSILYWVFTTNGTLMVYVVAVAVIFVALKALIAHVTGWQFQEMKIFGGTPLENKFVRLVPQRAQKVAIMGQNLKDRLADNYDLTFQSIEELLSRRDSDNSYSVKEFWLIVQTPLALFSIHPEAARHLESYTIQGLKNLANNLDEEAKKRVWIAFHPASTLSMLVVDWDLGEKRHLAVVTPKLQTIREIRERASLVFSGSDFNTVVPHFNRFLSEAKDLEFPGANAVNLQEAADMLEKMFNQEIVKCVRSYVKS